MLNREDKDNSKLKSPFHKGEQWMQTQVGKRDEMEQVGQKFIRDYMPDQHRDFFESLPFILVGSVDNNGWPWASILTSQPGFIHSPQKDRLHIRALPFTGDPLAQTQLKAGASLGILGIELPTRRRNRVNGTVLCNHSEGMEFQVEQSFGNCPQYIQKRQLTFVPRVTDTQQECISFRHFDSDSSRLIREADTLFVASYAPKEEGLSAADVSHRGGKPGFIKVEGNTLTIPDYAGNNFFNTLGNFVVYPKAGLTFVDFERGDVLMLTGTSVLLPDEHPDIVNFEGAERGWQFTLTSGVWLKGVLPFRAVLQEMSSQLKQTGDWSQGEKAMSRNGYSHRTWSLCRVDKVVDESSDIRSFYLVPEDGARLKPFLPGQHLMLKGASGTVNGVIRSYSLSSAPGDPFYRISVKRESSGVFSNYLHQQLGIGQTIEVSSPKGRFHLNDKSLRPMVLITSGVGITPMLSMVRHLQGTGASKRKVTLFHSAKNSKSRSFYHELQQFVQEEPHSFRYLTFLQQIEHGERLGIDFHGSGYFGRDVFQRYLPLDDYDVYLCGAASFMQAIYDVLRSLGIRDERIFAESFGPSKLTRQTNSEIGETASKKGGTAKPSASSARVKFLSLDTDAIWTEKEGSLLQFAEKRGLQPEFSCRSGRCGACSVPLLSGEVVYSPQIEAEISTGEVLLCCARPAVDQVEVDL